MYCYNCGKEIANEALMCPNCGAPTKNTNEVKQGETAPVVGSGVNTKALSVVGLILSVIAFVTGIIFEALFLTYHNAYGHSVILLYVLSASSILPALTGLSIGTYILVSKEKNQTARACAICSVVFASIVLFFLFLGCCLVAGNML